MKKYVQRHLFFLFFPVSCQMNNVYGRPGPNSIWSTTALGDVYVFDPAIAEVNIKSEICLHISISNMKNNRLLL